MSINNNGSDTKSIDEWRHSISEPVLSPVYSLPETPASFKSIGTSFSCPRCNGSFTVETKPDVLRQTPAEQTPPIPSFDRPTTIFQEQTPMANQISNPDSGFSCPWNNNTVFPHCDSCRVIGDSRSFIRNVTPNGFSSEFLHQNCIPDYSYTQPIQYTANTIPKDFKLTLPPEKGAIRKLKEYVQTKAHKLDKDNALHNIFFT